MAADRSHRAKRRGLVVALIAALVGLPVGFALAQGDETVEVGDPAQRETDGTAGLKPLPPADESLETDYAIEGPAGKRFVDACRNGDSLSPQGEPDDPLVCEMIIAVEEGRLAPGEYSRRGLRDELNQK